jgi:hypothetical protein
MGCSQLRKRPVSRRETPGQVLLDMRQEADMAMNIAFLGGAQLLGAGRKTDQGASIIARGTKWLNSLRVTRNDHRIERYINDHGGILTDSLEREITQKFINAEPGRY